MSATVLFGAWLMSALMLATSTTEALQQAPVSVLSVPVGQSLLIRSPGAKRVSAGDGATIDIKVLDDTQEILVLGRKAGTTDLRIWSRDGTSVAYLVQVLGILDPIATAAPTLQAETTILIKAKLIEVRKSALRDIGVDWADVAAGPVLSTDNGVDMTSSLDSVIRLLLTRGDARLLAEPTLTCISGGQADFVVGGEVPIPVQNQDGALNVVFKQFGILLNVEPRANDAGLIRTKVGVEVSSVDKANAVLGIPGFATRKTNTEMNVHSGAPMIVAGLFSADDAKNVAKIPGLGALPIIGELFKSRQFRRGETELVVLVTPEIIGTDSTVVSEGVQRFDRLKRESDEALKPRLKD
ncbi:type II and III secretion system protein family protein [Steroidobacter cummioxidans]|uniref:type II and III secretion system protein family protein n=1 Tax=Steroidobacter cummioxidans TaxID=1803913 RepID=UPI000E31EC92|nr:pilus assembly protein N-terminal domain-containing protein [Steroidobacter cummioxidans]